MARAGARLVLPHLFRALMEPPAEAFVELGRFEHAMKRLPSSGSMNPVVRTGAHVLERGA
jgi:hypothetical protein